MTPLELVHRIEKIHAPDIAGFAEAACIECNEPYPCDTAALIATWKDTHVW
jgi:hypothetical protein